MNGNQSGNTASGSGLFLGGTREHGPAVRLANVNACVAVANLVKSSLGPTGLDKLLVDDIGDVTITNDGATILSLLELDHPAARLLVDLATLQDHEVGDGTTSVVLWAAELLKRAHNLMQQHSLHPTAIMSGYRKALKLSIAELKRTLKVSSIEQQEELLQAAASTSLNSKLIGHQHYHDSSSTSSSDGTAVDEDFFAKLAVRAVQSLHNTVTNKYPLEQLHIVQIHGQSSHDSELLPHGFCLLTSRAAQGMPMDIVPKEGDVVKVALLDMNLQRHRMGLGVQVQVTDPKQVEQIRQEEMNMIHAKLQLLMDAGAQVILTTKGVDDIAMKYLVQAKVLCARRIPLPELQKLSQALGASIVTTLADLDGNESIDASVLGTCGRVRERTLGDQSILQFEDCHPHATQGTRASTIVLRGANEYMLGEIDRALHDACCVVKRLLESNSVVPGGGAVEVALNVYLHQQVLLEGKEQLAVHEFADALLIIPKTLAINSGHDSAELVAQLKSAHASGTQPYAGLDLMNGTIRSDNLAAGVVEPAISKIKSLRFATEAALTILRIDDRITMTNKQQQQYQ